MIYKVKEGSKTYEYIKDICEKEKEEREAFCERVEKMVGFKFGSFSGYTPNKSLNRKYYIITAMLVDDSTWESLDKKIWKQIAMVNGFHVVASSKRTKEEKETADVFNSCKSITTHWDIFNALQRWRAKQSFFTSVQIMYNENNKTYMVHFDDSIRADKDNSDLVEITMSEYDKIMED